MEVPVKIARAVHIVSAFWVLGLAVLIFCDVMGRQIFNQPVPGTKEILQNSVVAVTFLQVPLAIYSGSMLRTTFFVDLMPPMVRRALRTLSASLALAFFVGLMWSTWPAFWDAYRIGEYEGEGALRVATWPVRGIVLASAAFGFWAYLSMIWFDWTGQIIDEEAAPGTRHSPGEG